MSNLIDDTIGKHIADDFVIGDRKQGEEAISNMVERINNKIRNRNNIKNVTDDDTFAKVKDVMLQLDVPDQLEIIYHYYYDIGLIDQNFVKDMFGIIWHLPFHQPLYTYGSFLYRELQILYM